MLVNNCPAQHADDGDGGAAANGASPEALQAEALRELASVQAAATAAMAESTDLRRRNESLEAEVGFTSLIEKCARAFTIGIPLPSTLAGSNENDDTVHACPLRKQCWPTCCIC